MGTGMSKLRVVFHIAKTYEDWENIELHLEAVA